ncbi:hypothetical protein DL95DRAFT_450898 [Leptodontidium sp. 2 PMI_412]|nr:hypothetical protein DL95DRAFT_450898 [Leptodontidium sp. 2 PMI_412]
MSEALHSSCAAISVMLLKSILLFLSLTKVGLKMLLSRERPEYIKSIKQLPATERFEVRFGRRSFVTEKEREQERDEQHLKAEKELEILLMPYSVEEQLLNLNLAKITAALDQLKPEFNTTGRWFTMGETDGTLHSGAGTLL